MDINRNGLGFGLTICSMITRSLNGSISFVSEFEKGSVFKFNIEAENGDEFI